jgi:hypothetical protein
MIGSIGKHAGRGYSEKAGSESMCDVEHDAIATTVGCLSLVVPNFARAPLISGTSYLFDLTGAEHGALWWPTMSRDDFDPGLNDGHGALHGPGGVAGADEFQAVDIREQIGRGWGPRAD